MGKLIIERQLTKNEIQEHESKFCYLMNEMVCETNPNFNKGDILIRFKKDDQVRAIVYKLQNGEDCIIFHYELMNSFYNWNHNGFDVDRLEYQQSFTEKLAFKKWLKKYYNININRVLVSALENPTTNLKWVDSLIEGNNEFIKDQKIREKLNKYPLFIKKLITFYSYYMYKFFKFYTPRPYTPDSYINKLLTNLNNYN